MIKHVELTNRNGKVLRGYMDMPENFNGELVIFYHGFTGNKTEHAKHFLNFSRIISKYGYASLRMDFSGNGESDGDFPDFTMDTMMQEAEEMIESSFKIPGVKKLSLLGFSMGGGVACYMSGKYGNKISKLILWSPAHNINDIIKRRFESAPKLENGNAKHGTFEISVDMYESLYKYNPLENVSKFTNPVMIIQGKKDLSVEYMNSVRLSVLYPNCRLHINPTAGHGYDDFAERDDLYKQSLNFLLENK